MEIKPEFCSFYRPIFDILEKYDNIGIVKNRMLSYRQAELIDVYVNIPNLILYNPKEIKYLDFINPKCDNILEFKIQESSVKEYTSNLLETACFIGARFKDDMFEKRHGVPYNTNMVRLVVATSSSPSYDIEIEEILTHMHGFKNKNAREMSIFAMYSRLKDYFDIQRDINKLKNTLICSLEELIKNHRTVNENDEPNHIESDTEEDIERYKNIIEILNGINFSFEMPSKGEIIPKIIKKTDDTDMLWRPHISKIKIISKDKIE